MPEKKLKELIERIKVLKKRENDLVKRAKSLHAYFKKPRKLVFPDLVKSYTGAVKKTDGLTTMRPSCLKAVQAAENAPSAKSFKAAVSALSSHSSETLKKNGKDKKAKQFKKDLDEIRKKISAYL